MGLTSPLDPPVELIPRKLPGDLHVLVCRGSVLSVRRFIFGHMPTVYRTPEGRRFHKNLECPSAVGAEPVELAGLRIRPCGRCYPDVPRSKVVRRYCHTCDLGRVLPCEHNGGVKVTYTFQTNYVSLLRDPGDEVTRSAWVWPDQAWLYEDLVS